jgi:DNA-binding IclR family transcriptional regulator
MNAPIEPFSEEAPPGSRGIQSIETGGQVLKALAHFGRPTALKDLAKESGMSPGRAHPYLVSLIKIGLVQKDERSGRYGLGPLALELGLISLQQVDPIRLAEVELPVLARSLGHTVGVAIWGSRGPTFVRVEDGPTEVHVSMRHGTVVSLSGTASGLLFSAFSPWAAVADMLGGEPPFSSAGWRKQFEAELVRIRAARFASIEGGVTPGVSGIAAPVFDALGRIALALTAIGPSPTLSTAPNAAAAVELQRVAAELSARLGARPIAQSRRA